ncbi:hypothetical protein GWK47_017443 [Chionoecetes opilio]|uniref:Uncharacterized protein n=1 Tax=Chionoecetes opilio TaxID=41210 RepID=A0A8J4XVX1_CHIOP|nr:hypothetical protein GWK47_017443 [Chionoecetes opilio]
MWTVSPIIISGVGGANCSRRQVGQWHGESMAAAVVSALETWGVADQVVGMSFDTTASNTGRRNGGPCPHRTENGERPAAFRLSSPYPGAGGTYGVRPCSGCSSSPEHLLFKRFQTPMGEHRPRGLRHGNHGGGSGDVLEDVKDEALRWTLQILQEREGLRDDYRELVKLVIIFLGGAPSRGNSIPCSWSNAPGQMDVKSPSTLQDLDVPGPVPLDEEGGRGLQRLCLFVVRVYAKAWIEASFSVLSPSPRPRTHQGPRDLRQDRP